jgi:ATP-dependent DNA helicase RecG
MYLKGVGPKLGERFENLGLRTCGDLLFYAPLRFQRVTLVERLEISLENQEILVQVQVSAVKNYLQRTSVQTTLVGSGDTLQLLFFQKSRRVFAAPHLVVGSTIWVRGTLMRQEGFCCIHPKVTVGEKPKDSPFEPIYGLTGGLTHTKIVQCVQQVLQMFPSMEWYDSAFLESQQWPSVRDSFFLLHAPQNPGDFRLRLKALERLAFDRSLAYKLFFRMQRIQHQKRPSYPVKIEGTVPTQLLRQTQLTLTQAQEKAWKDIQEDLSRSFPMKRLIQGEVGSGKSLLAYLTIAAIVEAGGQAAYIAPTTVLAQQQYAKIEALLTPLGISSALLVGGGKGTASLLEGLAEGETKVIVGTHALLEDMVRFQKLALVVIDEQQRFGVEQRLKLLHKNAALFPHLLIMTATPIPRSYLLTQWGDTDITQLRTRPFNKPIPKTYLFTDTKLPEIRTFIHQHLQEGGRVFWLCPLIEASEESRKTSLEERFLWLQEAFGEQVDFLHGRLKDKEKIEKLQAFQEGRSPLLLSTTVIETGVNIPEATLMVIEDAPFFGLSQLHQLRGRVGRGEREGLCFALYKPPLSESAAARLRAFKEAETGFEITEKDCQLRGGGQALGTAQSGFFETLVPVDHRLLDSYLQKQMNSPSGTLVRYRMLLELFLPNTQLTFLDAA